MQDAAAAIPARLLKLAPGARVLDLCAAPGGKTAQLLKAGYAVTALDNDAERMARVGTNLERLGYTAELVTADALDWEPAEKFDGILLDAPCSATGTFRRHPEVIWHRDAKDICGARRPSAAVHRAGLSLAETGRNPGLLRLFARAAGGRGTGRNGCSRRMAWNRFPLTDDELPGLEPALTLAGFVRTHPGLSVPGDKGGTLDGFFVARVRRR